MSSEVEEDQAKPSLRARAQEVQRAELARVACEMVDESGLESLSLRKLATRVGASTSVVYTLFGSKDGLLREMAQHALQKLSEPMAAVESAVSLQYVSELALAFRAAALASPTYYRLLQRGVLRDELETLARDSCAYQTLLHAVQRCFDASLLTGSSVDAVTESLWSVVHGLVSLELAGYWSDPSVSLRRFVECGGAVLRGFSPAED